MQLIIQFPSINWESSISTLRRLGGWRQITDPIWGRPLYVSPVQGRSTWGVNEVRLDLNSTKRA